ncbi:protein kinase family protein [Rhodococcoides fascians]|uniref:protein kinase family protein n=1 Tax=Rhodococcoides fascians TaxID=1828 RepID=UPI0005617ED5|nr:MULTISPECIES: protein kinase family protein [Rhodococcus]OZF01262.1 serine/threonine protein kinase [Rhodococcus sp. 15-1189-1-1a]OZF15433.1 serine/threonine protein kinase [Rhodococcus sp. 14-2686-1-2]
MANPAEFMLADLREKYLAVPSSRSFDRLYDDPALGHMFAVLHKLLNEHFTAINGRAETTHHYWADNSRELLWLIKDVEADLHTLKLAGVEVELADSYQDALERCRPWLSPSGGSTVPEDFEPIEVVAYEPVLTRAAKIVKLKKHHEAIELKMVGSGSYAHVYSYVDPDYGIKFAVKRAKKDLPERDLERFKQEFDVLRKLSFPYVVEVYRYEESSNEYRMEYCDTTLRDYIRKKNSTLSFAARKRIALQFLYGVNYIHHEQLLHRDISLQNILLKVFGAGAVLVKLSDFGLVKDQASAFTRTQTEMKGTIRDPVLGSFKDYAVVNEMYSIGHILAYIFTGRESLPPATDDVGRIIHKCAINDVSLRYQAVTELIADTERLEAPPVQTTA